MAVYTKLSENKLKDFFSKYNLGKLLNYKEIKEGIENTNYFIQTEKNKFILTLYEKRVDEKDLPFFMSLMKNLHDKNFPSPKPIININGNYISEISNKKAAVVSFLDGSSKKNLNPKNCYEVGVNTAKLHLITKNLVAKRKNKLSVLSWRKIYNKVKKDCSKIHPNLIEIIEKNLEEIEHKWPKNIPSGIIHADLFPDNIFFKNDKNELHTPTPDSFLDGITRRCVIGIAKSKGIKIVERKIKPEEMSNFIGCFLTGTAAEITPVSQIDKYQFKVCSTIKELSESYQNLVRKKSAA